MIYTEGTIPWETAWSMSLPDQTVVLESFNSLVQAKSGQKDSKDVMTQEMIVDEAVDPGFNPGLPK